MNIFELFWFVLFLGGGVFAGLGIGGVVGGIGGGLLGAGGVVLFTRSNAKAIESHPPCRCGATRIEDFSVQKDLKWGFLSTCRMCGRSYVAERGAIWDEVSSEGQRLPFFRRRFGSGWRPGTESPGYTTRPSRSNPQGRRDPPAPSAPRSISTR